MVLRRGALGRGRMRCGSCRLLAFRGVALLQRLGLLLVLGLHLRHRLRISLLRGCGGMVTVLLLSQSGALLLMTGRQLRLSERERLLLIRGAFTGGGERFTRGQIAYVHGRGR